MGGDFVKRRITPEQLQKLTEEQKQKLRNLWEPLEGDWFLSMLISKAQSLYSTSADPFECCVPDKDNGDLPLLDIGQMIEMLREEYPDLDLYVLTNYAGTSVWKGIGKFDGYKAESDERIGFDKNELCDALWEAVKQILLEAIL